MRKDQLKNLPHLKTNRQELRKNQTPAEETLWQYLRNEQLEGRKFRRQHGIENYIVDFYCASERLIIELDGEHHSEGETYFNDCVRDARLQQLGYRVLRFSNYHISENLQAVLNQIAENFQNQKAA
jgi:very-short-patch-repair endonuclease